MPFSAQFLVGYQAPKQIASNVIVSFFYFQFFFRLFSTTN